MLQTYIIRKEKNYLPKLITSSLIIEICLILIACSFNLSHHFTFSMSFYYFLVTIDYLQLNNGILHMHN